MFNFILAVCGWGQGRAEVASPVLALNAAALMLEPLPGRQAVVGVARMTSALSALYAAWFWLQHESEGVDYTTPRSGLVTFIAVEAALVCAAAWVVSSWFGTSKPEEWPVEGEVAGTEKREEAPTVMVDDGGVIQTLRNSGLFEEWPPRSSTGSVRFQLREGDWVRRGASIYVISGEREVHIRVRPLESGDGFPNNQALHDYVRERSSGVAHGAGNTTYSYRLESHHVPHLVKINREGLQGDPCDGGTRGATGSSGAVAHRIGECRGPGWLRVETVGHTPTPMAHSQDMHVAARGFQGGLFTSRRAQPGARNNRRLRYHGTIACASLHSTIDHHHQ